MTGRILILVGFLVILPLLGSLGYWLLLVEQPIDSTFWTSTFLPGMVGWAAFWAAIAELTGYSLRDLIADRGKWQPKPDKAGSGLKGVDMKHQKISTTELQLELERKRELREVTKKRLHNLQMKGQEHGAAALTADEAAELREKEKEVAQLSKDILYLEKKIEK